MRKRKKKGVVEIKGGGALIVFLNHRKKKLNWSHLLHLQIISFMLSSFQNIRIIKSFFLKFRWVKNKPLGSYSTHLWAIQNWSRPVTKKFRPFWFSRLKAYWTQKKTLHNLAYFSAYTFYWGIFNMSKSQTISKFKNLKIFF